MHSTATILLVSYPLKLVPYVNVTFQCPQEQLHQPTRGVHPCSSGAVTQRQWQNSALEDVQIYYFAVTAFDANGNESAYSTELAVQDGVVVETAGSPVSGSPSMDSSTNERESCFISTGMKGASLKDLTMRWCKLFKGEIQ